MTAECPIATGSPEASIWGCPLAAASRGAGARVRSQLSAAAREQSPGHSPRPCRLDTFPQLLREAKSQESTCCFTYSCQRGKNRLNSGCCRHPIPCHCQLLSRVLLQHYKACAITPQAASILGHPRLQLCVVCEQKWSNVFWEAIPYGCLL